MLLSPIVQRKSAVPVVRRDRTITVDFLKNIRSIVLARGVTLWEHNSFVSLVSFILCNVLTVRCFLC